MNAAKLKGKIVERGINVEKLAEYLAIDRATLYRKINNFDKFTIGEARKVKSALELTDEEATLIFFD